jgi:DNA-directed RNA polymerase II subunit RPB1
VLPANVTRLITNAQKQYKIDLTTPSNLSPLKVISGINELCKKMVVVVGQDALSLNAQHNATILIQALVKSHLSPKMVSSQFLCPR